MKVLFEAQGIEAADIKNLEYIQETGMLTFQCKNKSYAVGVIESLTSYVKVYENDSIEIINKEASLK